MIKIIVLRRFSIRNKETKKLEFYEVSSNPVEIENKIGQKAVAMGYAKLASNKVENK